MPLLLDGKNFLCYIAVMVKEILKAILDYTDFLKNSLELQVSICNITGSFDPYMHILQPYNSHYNPYCVCIKSNEKTKNICVQKQMKVLQKSADGAFYGSCWAGVEEFVFPIKWENHALGFISVSGYRGQLAFSEEKIKRLIKTFNFNQQALYSKYYQLDEDVPSFNKIRPLIVPLCLMFEMLYSEIPHNLPTDTKETSLYADILNFLCFNYTRNLTLDDIAKEMHYSKSYIRQIFHKKSNHTISHYLIILRMKRAKELLLNENISIRDIAYEVGYDDPNYFTNVFRKEVGISPRAYRKQLNSLQESSILDQFCDI